MVQGAGIKLMCFQLKFYGKALQKILIRDVKLQVR